MQRQESWTVHENVSSILAAFCYRRRICHPDFLEIPPTVGIATVLIAVQTLTRPTSAAIESSAPRLRFYMGCQLINKGSMPPFSRIISAFHLPTSPMMTSSPVPDDTFAHRTNQPYILL